MCIEIIKPILISIYFIFAHWLTTQSVNKMYNYLSYKRIANKLTATLGCIDRLAYALLFAFDKWTLIGVWLGIKIASRLTVRTE